MRETNPESSRRRIRNRAKNQARRFRFYWKCKLRINKTKTLIPFPISLSPKKPNKLPKKRKRINNPVEELNPIVKNEILCKPKPVGVEGLSPLVRKYWFQRYNLFSMYDEGILMDEEGWFSVTPEQIAIRHAEKTGGGTVIDCFAGVGGNAIQFAKMCYHVVAIDIDPQKIELAINNARIYGVEDYIDFIIGDFFQLASSLKGDVVFLSPPWGGPSYSSIENFTLDQLKPRDGYCTIGYTLILGGKKLVILRRNSGYQMNACKEPAKRSS